MTADDSLTPLEGGRQSASPSHHNAERSAGADRASAEAYRAIELRGHACTMKICGEVPPPISTTRGTHKRRNLNDEIEHARTAPVGIRHRSCSADGSCA